MSTNKYNRQYNSYLQLYKIKVENIINQDNIFKIPLNLKFDDGYECIDNYLKEYMIHGTIVEDELSTILLNSGDSTVSYIFDF